MLTFYFLLLSNRSKNQPPGLYIAHQAPLSMGFFKQEYWSELSFPLAGDLPDPGIEPGFHASQAGSLSAEPLGKSKNHLEETNSTLFAYLFTGSSSSSLLA